LRDESNTRSTWRFNALMMPMRANFGGPPNSATSNSFHCGLPFFGIVFCLGQFGGVLRGIAERDQRFPARHRDRIDKPLIPRHEFAFAPNWWRNEGIWQGQQAFL